MAAKTLWTPTSKSTLPLPEAQPPSYNHSQENIDGLLAGLSNIESTSLPEICASKSSTALSFALPEHVPLLVLYPKSTQEVSNILKACHGRNIAVTSFGGGTSLGGALAATRGGICIDFRDMDGVLEVNEGDQDVRVQPNVGWVELSEYLEPRGFWFPVDPAKGARIGGMIAMGCSGTNAYRYGTIKAHVLSLTLVLADGTVVKTRNRPRKSSAGYDLTNLIVGSEGTLALVTEAILKITPLPKNPQVGLAVFASMDDGVAVAIAIMKSGMQLEALELVDGDCMQCINHSKLASDVFEERPTLFLKFAGSAQGVKEQVSFVQGLCEERGVTSCEFTGDKHRMDAIWDARKCLGNALATMKKHDSDLVITTDAAVPVSKLARLVEGSREIVKEQAGEQGWWSGSVGHVGDGNVHTAIVCPQSAKAEVEQLLAKIQRLALELEGTITGEHGIGLKLRDLLNEEVGTEGVDAMRKIKFALDPKGILNPDKVVRLEAGV